ncbi:uncharacterized protein LOC132739478 [Ruditapes philippinarum]|uniref:uncharacterized protein LOC132739478 n=1 Tax=Ruditapes philippinarum TaxID=129788 RepID=UPI00295B8CA6|nr:uncharacterized protein LOC132739478 [Ruditapes philippinarum]
MRKNSVLSQKICKRREARATSFTSHVSVHNKSKSNSNQRLSSPATPVHSQYSITSSSHILEPSETAYFTSSLNEGYGNVEEVSENFSFDTNVLNENDEEEIFIATPLELGYFPASDTNDKEFDFDSSKTCFSTLDSIETYTSPYHSKLSSNSDSDSDTEVIFEIFPDTSSDEDYSSVTSPKYNDKEPLTYGNLPNFDELEPVKKEKELFKPPVNPLVSKRIPTATSTFSLESNEEESSYISDKSHSSVKDGHKKVKRETSITADEKKTATFCSTNIQTALLSKITPDRKSKKVHNSPFDEFLKMQLQRKALHTEVPGSKSGHDRDIEVDLENFETEVGKAFEESVSEGSLMPLLKQELQCKIQVRRLSMGQSELVLEPEEPKVYKLTEDEIKKKQARLEQNRRSAKKSRHKARKHEQNLLNHIKKAMTKNTKLRKEVSKLQTIRDKYKKTFDLHMMSCTATSSSTPP